MGAADCSAPLRTVVSACLTPAGLSLCPWPSGTSMCSNFDAFDVMHRTLVLRPGRKVAAWHAALPPEMTGRLVAMLLGA